MIARTLGVVVAVLLAAGALAAPPKPVFEDRFEGRLAEGWKWIREDSAAWRLAEGGLEVRLQPGDAGTVKNALVRRAPDRSQGKYAVGVVLTSLAPPTRQYEQAGITWYHAGKPVFKLVKELVDGQLCIIPGKKPMTVGKVELRLVVTADTWTAQYRPNAEGEFQTAASGTLPPPGEDEVSLQGYHGPADAEHWVRFDDFRVEKLPD